MKHVLLLSTAQCKHLLVGWLVGGGGGGEDGGSVSSWLFTFTIKFNQRLLTLSLLTSNPSPVLMMTVLLLSVPSLQASVYDILLPTNAITGYAIGAQSKFITAQLYQATPLL